jgi:hypothetical protein
LNTESIERNTIKSPKPSSGGSLPDLDVAIVGAGPYGMSAAAHLQAKGLGIRIFGEPMEFWAKRMPEGMLLRSPRVASNISDPDDAFSLDAYEAASKIQATAPLPRTTFVDYGLWFQHQFGPALDKRTVAQVQREGNAFKITVNDGEVFRSRRVVVATGIGPLQKRPRAFAGMPAELVSHCYEGREIREFVGKRIAVIGAGQSALESAALLHEAGASVEVIAATPELRYIGQHQWLHGLGPLSKMLYSKHDIGPMGISRLVAYPKLMSYVPLALRDKIRVRAVKPAGARWLPSRVQPIKVSAGCRVNEATSSGNGLHLRLDNGGERHVDHVLLGTGYSVDIARYDFLSRDLVKRVKQLDGYPDLAAGLHSSVPGLHFVGAAAAKSFGPLLYFVAGTEFSSRELTSYIARNRARVS